MDQAVGVAEQLHPGRVRPQQHRFGEEPVLHEVVDRRGGMVVRGGAATGLVRADRPHRRVVVGDADGAGPRGAQCRDRPSVAEQQVVGDRERGDAAGQAGRVDTEDVPEGEVDVRLVVRQPQRHPVTEGTGDEARVLPEPLGVVPRRPAAGILQRLRQVPVVQREDRRDAPREQRVDQPVVEGDPGGVGRSGAGGLDPWPRHREPVCVDAQPGHEGHVVGEPVVVVARHIAGAAVGDAARLVAEGVPDRRSPAVLGGRTLDLVCRGRHAPPEAGWECWDRRGHCQPSANVKFPRTLTGDHLDRKR